MKKTADKKSRCHHHTACGRRCRKPISAPESSFCELHQPDASAQAEPDLSAALAGGIEEFTSPATINEFLSRLLLLLSENRISPRRAAVLAYITNQILRTITVMEAAAAAAAQARQKLPPKIIWDMPGPPHEQEPQPSPVPQLSGARASAQTAATARSGA
jgi:hypothetical protein